MSHLDNNSEAMERRKTTPLKRSHLRKRMAQSRSPPRTAAPPYQTPKVDMLEGIFTHGHSRRGRDTTLNTPFEAKMG